MPGRVLVGVDARDQAGDATALGARLAEALGDELVVCHIYPYDLFADSIALGAPPDTPLQAEAKATVARAVHHLDPATIPLVAPHTSIVEGLHREAGRTSAEMLVVGSSHRGPVGRVALGTHTTGVLHGAPCSVAVAPRGLAGSGWALTTIAVAHDGSEEAGLALGLARRLARRDGARLRLVTVVERPPPAWAGDGLAVADDWETYEARARERAELMLEQAARADEQIEVHLGLDAADRLLAVGGEVSLLVMGSRAHGAIRRVLAGSTARRVMREAPCPVVVVPRGARRDESPGPRPAVRAGG